MGKLRFLLDHRKSVDGKSLDHRKSIDGKSLDHMKSIEPDLESILETKQEKSKKWVIYFPVEVSFHGTVF